MTLRPIALFLLTATTASSHASRLVCVRAVDESTLMVHWEDGTVEYRDDGTGKGAREGHAGYAAEILHQYGEPLNIDAVSRPASFSLISPDDSGYLLSTPPAAVSRRTKVNGTTNEWPEPRYTVEHTAFLRLARPLRAGCRYNLFIEGETNSDRQTATLTMDADTNETEALHVNLIGYHPASPTKSADLYMWLGDGGFRDYKAFEGRETFLLDVETGKRHSAGKVAFWRKSGPGLGKWNATASDVWTCDFSTFRREGTYRLVVDGIGCSPKFRIARDAFFDPYRVSLQGFFFMRIGESPDFKPIPRQPRFIPDQDPPGFKVYRTTFGPWHPDWPKKPGDVWDVKDWSEYKEPGEPTNPNAWGGHSDAMDWDRHAGHISIIWDMLLPYFLSNGKLADDDLGIRESTNGVPDLLDEARYEVDFWLRLRDGEGNYSFGLNNPMPDYKVMYQAAARPYMAWANAANAAMLADAYRLAKKPDLMRRYQKEALEAWRRANDQDLDYVYGIGNGATRGRDLKMIAAAHLYNLTGDQRYEDALADESVVRQRPVGLDDTGKYCQYWGTAAYLMADKYRWRPIHRPELVRNMKAAVMAEARRKHVDPIESRPTRRSSDEAHGWFQGTISLDALLIAHAVAPERDRGELWGAMLLEADYSLGRNPLNMVLMTGLGSRHAEAIYTSGRNDGYPGNHPGHTPYMNSEPWGQGYMADPKWYAAKGYPKWEEWPHGEALWRAPYCYSNNEFTPQQSMRGKTALYAYLASLEK
jgi:hypothetical protein